MVLAVDGNSLVHRSFHSQARTGLRSADGRPMWAVRGLLTALVAAAERIAPDTIVVGFDDPGTSLRRQKWPQYKANRADKLDTLVEQLAYAAEILQEMGVAVVVPDGLEADDVLASAARSADASTVIMTSDRDAFTLIDEHTSVLRVIDGGVEASPMLTPQRLVMLLGIRPDQYLDYAALRGDASDNLPGVRGIGPKTAAMLLASLGSARAAFDDVAGSGGRVADAIGVSRAERLRQPDARATWELNCQVMAMHDDIPLDPGAGRLPLPVDAVCSAFAASQLTWTTSAAMRDLAGQESADAAREPERVEPSWDWSAPRQRFGRLPKPAPTMEQLALF